MITIPQHQQEYIMDDFNFGKHFFPINFYTREELIQMLCGTKQCGSDEFIDACMTMYKANKEHLHKLDTLYMVVCVLIVKARGLEYYEAESNLREMKKYLLECAEKVKDIKIQDSITPILEECGVTTL